MRDEGHDDSEIGELLMLSPWEVYDSLNVDLAPPPPPVDSTPTASAPPAPTAQIDKKKSTITAVLTVARDKRKPPKKQVVVAPAPTASPTGPVAAPADVQAIRVETEDSYRQFRSQMDGRGAPASAQALDYSDEDPAAVIERAAQNELLGFDDFYVRPQEVSSVLGGSTPGFYVRPQERGELFGTSPTCLLCGRENANSAVCSVCRAHPSIIGYPMPGTARGLEMLGLRPGTARLHEMLGLRPGTARLHEMLGFGERGSAADMYNEDFYVRPEERAELSLIGAVSALESPYATAYDGCTTQTEIPLSLKAHMRSGQDPNKHVSTWQYGPNLYSSARITGWDGKPRILTSTVPYAKSMGVVVGYAQEAIRCGLVDEHTVRAALPEVGNPLARQLGVSSLLPRIGAAASCRP